MSDDSYHDEESEPADEFPDPPPFEDEPDEEQPPPVEGPPIEEEPEEEEEELIGDGPLAYRNEEMVSQEAEIEKISPSSIPLNVRFEIGRVNVSLEELQKMSPGYKLPMDVNPRIVNLTVNGKSIGKGELIEVGESVGIKVLELY